MLPENAIEVKNITKKFKIYYDKGNTLKEKVLFKNRRIFEEREVLKGISFNVKKGEAIGLIGHNGCGKSTTLKLLTRIMYPDSGTIEIRGRVSSLIELGAGFHPDMTGRENIYTNAAIFGLTRKEIAKRIGDIIAFSELGDYIDNPVRTYSSGMYMRLAFSVAINVDAEVLLIDEILGVGDAGFQVKCFEKLKEIKAAGTTIVIVSHALGQIEQICERSIWINNGEICMEGVPKEIHCKYMESFGFQNNEENENYNMLYDAVISLGGSCQVAHQLNRLKLRQASFPFDWLFTLNVNTIINAIDSDFCDWLNKDNLREESTVTEHRKIIDTKYDAVHQHSFSLERPWEESYLDVKSIADRRIKRLLALKDKKLLFVRTNIDVSDAERLEQSLVKKFGEHISLWVINHSKNFHVREIQNDLKHTRIFEIYDEMEGERQTWMGWDYHYDQLFCGVAIKFEYVDLRDDIYFDNFWQSEFDEQGNCFRWSKEKSTIDLRRYGGCKCRLQINSPIPMKLYILNADYSLETELNIEMQEEFLFEITYKTRFITIKPEFTWTAKDKFGNSDERILGICLNRITVIREAI